MDRSFRLGGLVASVILIATGLGAVVIGVLGRADVTDRLKQERITGTPDMTPKLTAAAIEEAGLEGVDAPDCSVAGKAVDTGARAKCFADYIRVHSLEATGGRTYSEMPRFATANGMGTDDAEAALKTDDGAPQDNPARTIWVTATSLSTALNTSFFAQQVALFAIVMGVALLLTGIGFLVLVLGLVKRP